MSKQEGVESQLVMQVLGLIQMIVPLTVLAVSGFMFYKLSMSFFVQAEANEWLLVIRNGELLKKGIGLSTWIWPGDQTVSFPSLINQVNFTA